MRVFLLACLLFVCACTDRSIVPYHPTAAEEAGVSVERVFVSTLRTENETGWFGGDRASELSFLTLDISIPPERDQGEIPRSFATTPNPQKHLTITKRQDHQNSASFSKEIQRSLSSLPADERDVMIYVHGYNNTFTDGVFRSAQMQADFQTPGALVHFSWPSGANPLGYTYDRDSVLYSRDALEQTLKAISAAKPRQIILVGHSLGTMLVMEALRQIELSSPGWTKRHLGGVILIAPDIDVDLFLTQTERFKELPYPFIIFTSSQDGALQLSQRINGNHVRLGSLQTPEKISDLPVTLIDVSEFATGLGADHFTPGTSPLLIKLLKQSNQIQEAFEGDRAGRSGIWPGTVITMQRSTQVVLSPLLMMQ